MNLLYKRVKEAFDKVEAKTLLRLNNLDLSHPKGIEQNYTLPMIGRDNKEVFITDYVTNCKTCHNWLKNMANIVFVTKKGNIVSPFERIETDGLDLDDIEFIKEMKKRIKKAKKAPELSVAFVSDEKTVLTQKENYAVKIVNGVEKEFKFEHFHCSNSLENKLKSITPTDASQINGLAEKIYNTLVSYPKNIVELALDLAKNAIYRGQEQVNKLESLLKVLEKVEDKDPKIYAWTLLQTPEIAIYNTALGTLLDDLKEKSIDDAVASFEAKMYNYKRTTKIATPRMRKEALKTIKELGYEQSLARRMAKLEDISAEDVLWLNQNAQSATMVDNSLEQMLGINETPKFDSKNAIEINTETFVEEKLPEATDMWVGVSENTKFALVAPVNKEAKPLTNWNNNFSWAYMSGGEDANLFDTRTKELGGKTDSYFRATLLWNDEDTPNLSDMDLHIGFGNAQHSDVYYSHKYKNGFELDIDIINPDGVAVENITTEQDNFMKQTFTVSIHTFTKNTPSKGFKVQIKIGDKYLYYHFNNEVINKKYYPILKFKKGEIIEEYMQPVNSVDNTQFKKVVTVFNSPNYWVQGGNNKGNKHLMFAIDNFTPESKFLGIIPEHLATHLQPHRRVFDTISSNLMVEPVQNAIAGVGKSYTNKKITIPVILKTNRGYISYLIK